MNGRFKKGNIPWNKGKNLSKEYIKKLSDAHLGQPAWNIGIPMTKKAKKKLSLSRKGSIPWNKGKKGLHISQWKGKKRPEITGKNHPRWKGGRFIRKSKTTSYIILYQPNHLFARKGYVREHRLVMEKHLGRYLKETEVMHHIDGNGLNNKLNNLMLFPNGSAHRRFHNKLKIK